MKQWSDRLAALQQVAVIKNITIRTLDSDGGSVSLALVESEALKNALASHDLALVVKVMSYPLLQNQTGNEWAMLVM